MEFTLLATFTIHHLIVGMCLILFLMTLTKVLDISAELSSWLWAVAFVLSTITPFFTISEELPITQLSSTVANVDHNNVKTAEEAAISGNRALRSETFTQWHIPSVWIAQMSYVLYLFAFIWLVGSLWRSIQVMRAAVATHQLITQARPIKNPTLSSISETILLSNTARSPMVVGLFHPVIIIPSHLSKRLSNKQILPLLLHEAAHIQRYDLWFGLFQEVLAIVFWWSPVMRVINRKVHIYRELACDLRAVHKLSNKKDYAQSLLDSTKLMLTYRQNILGMSLFSKKKDLTYRINQVLNIKQKRPPNVFMISLCCGIFSTAAVASIHQYAPEINVKEINRDANHFSKLTRSKSELLIKAIYDNDTRALTAMLKNGLDINTPIIGGGTALIMAVKQNNQTMVRTLIDLGADVNQSARGDGNPLIAAAINGNLALAKTLLDEGADVDTVVIGDETPLIRASWSGRFDVVKLLIDRGANVNLGVEVSESWGKEYRSPLSKAQNNEIRQYLLDNGAVL